MKFPVVLKFVAYTAAIFAAADSLHWYYQRQKKRIPRPSIQENIFIMTDAIPCCAHSVDIREVEACINPHCKAKLSHKIIGHINSAKHLICIAMYMLTMRRIADALLAAKKRGVIVRIITDKSMIGTSNSQINILQREGIAVRIAGDGDRYMHNKFCLIDVLNGEDGFNENNHPNNGLLINGSLNWTTNGFDRNWENVQFMSDEYMKSDYKRAFDYIWSRL